MPADAPAKPVLYDYPLSFGCQVARLCLVEKGVAFRRRTVDIGPGMAHLEPWFVATNPAMTLPVLFHEDRYVHGVDAICRYVDGAFEGPLLDHRNDAQGWIDLALGQPIQLLTYARWPRWAQGDLRRRFRRLEALARINPALTALYAQKAEEVDRLARDLRWPERVAASQRQLEVILDQAEAALTHRPYLAGDAYTLADMVWTALLARLAFLGYGHLWARDVRPQVAEWWQRVSTRPSVRKAGVRARLSLWDLAGAALRSWWGPALRLLTAVALFAGAYGAWLHFRG